MSVPQPPGSPGGLAELSPAYFALVMATGIVSLASQQMGLHSIAVTLFGLNVVAWVALWLLSAARMVRHRRRFFGDMVDHLRGPGFFTMVAGTAVLGSQCALLASEYRAAVALWAFLRPAYREEGSYGMCKACNRVLATDPDPLALRRIMNGTVQTGKVGLLYSTESGLDERMTS